MSFGTDLEVYIRARFTLLCVVTLEEESVMGVIKDVCNQTGRRLYSWDHADFFRVLNGEGAPPIAKDPLSALTAIEGLPDDSVFVLKDFHQCWHGQPR